MVNCSTRGNVLVCVTITLVLLISFSSDTSMAQQHVHFSNPGMKSEEQETKINDKLFQASKAIVKGSFSDRSPHADFPNKGSGRGGVGGRRLL
ncbi:hypothetical protein LINGRAHAP2_LOCUS12768 [Linum grandiflorum]